MASATSGADWSLVVHGGVGDLTRATLTAEQDAGARAGLKRAAEAGAAVLARGGAAVDAVQAAVSVLEDDPHFNAGRGAVFSWHGRNELDAAIMEGTGRRAGSVAGVTRVKKPGGAGARGDGREPARDAGWRGC